MSKSYTACSHFMSLINKVMKYKLLVISPFFIFILFSCAQEKKTLEVNISEFNIDNAALSNGERLTFFSAPMISKANIDDYSKYVCLIGVADSSKDTFNILVYPFYAMLSPTDNQRYFVSSESVEYDAILSMVKKESTTISTPSVVIIASEVEMETYKRFPTVIGLLANKRNQIGN